MNTGNKTLRTLVAVVLAIFTLVLAATQPLAACTGGSCGGIGGILNVQTVKGTR